MWRFLLAMVVCSSCGGVCPTRQTIAALDGGVERCLRATDCPRADGMLVCQETLDMQRGCVGCEDTQCVRYVRQTCG